MGVLDGSAGAGNQATGQGSAGNSGGSESGQSGTGTAGSAGGSTGGGQATWRDTLPEDIRSNPALQSFTDVGTLAKSYLHAQSLVGKKGVFVPADGATPEDWKAFYKSVGQPDLDKFEIKAPEGKKLDEAFTAKFKEASHKMGLLPKQAQEMMAWYIAQGDEHIAGSKQAREAAEAEAVNGLKQEWGHGWDKQTQLANLGMKKGMGELGQATYDWVQKMGLANDPMMIKIFNQMGKLMGEHTLTGETNGRMGSKTPQEIRSEIDRIMADPDYTKRNSPRQTQLVKQLEVLFQQKASQAS